MNELTYGLLFDKSWAAIKKNLALSAGLTLVYLLAVMAFSMIPFMGSFLGSLMAPGYLYCLIRIRDHQNIEFRDFFWSFQDFNRFLNLLVMSFVHFIVLVIGFILLIIPGIYVAVALSVASPYFVFRKQDGIEALRASAKLVTQHWWFMFGLAILVLLLNLVGALCFLLGLLVTIPMSVLILYYSMEALEKITPDFDTKTVV